MLLATNWHEQTHQLVDWIITDHKFHTDLEQKQRCMDKPMTKSTATKSTVKDFLKMKALLLI